MSLETAQSLPTDQNPITATITNTHHGRIVVERYGLVGMIEWEGCDHMHMPHLPASTPSLIRTPIDNRVGAIALLPVRNGIFSKPVPDDFSRNAPIDMEKRESRAPSESPFWDLAAADRLNGLVSVTYE